MTETNTDMASAVLAYRRASWDFLLRAKATKVAFAGIEQDVVKIKAAVDELAAWTAENPRP